MCQTMLWLVQKMSLIGKQTFSILLFKVALLLLFSSAYNNSLFTPFLSHFVQNLSNPWQYYLDNNLNLDAFPYHSFMLALLAPFVFFGEFFGAGGLF